MSLSSYVRYPLLFGPSPVHPLERLTRHLGGCRALGRAGGLQLRCGVRRNNGMVTDPVYEGKSMAGMIDLVARGEIGRDATVLYAHLGGQPALNAYSALF